MKQHIFVLYCNSSVTIEKIQQDVIPTSSVCSQSTFKGTKTEEVAWLHLLFICWHIADHVSFWALERGLAMTSRCRKFHSEGGRRSIAEWRFAVGAGGITVLILCVLQSSIGYGGVWRAVVSVVFRSCTTNPHKCRQWRSNILTRASLDPTPPRPFYSL